MPGLAEGGSNDIMIASSCLNGLAEGGSNDTIIIIASSCLVWLKGVLGLMIIL